MPRSRVSMRRSSTCVDPTPSARPFATSEPPPPALAPSSTLAAHGLSGDGGIAVLVQRMLAPEAAGVAFTADPVTGRRDEIVITAARGLGERVVSGEAVGDEWVVATWHRRVSAIG